MSLAAEIKKLKENPCIVKAGKDFHKGALIGHVSNGGGVVELGDGYALRFTALNDKFVHIQLLDYGKNIPVKTQSWQKTKQVVAKENKPEFEFGVEGGEEQKRENLF